MNTILSLDLDILFSPYVGIYNQFIFEDKPYEFLWEKIQEQYDINDFKINNNYLEYIKNLLLKYKDKVDKIYIGYDHSDILNVIEKEKEIFSMPYKFDIYNIDYHHDIGYIENQMIRIKEEKVCDCGSWIAYLSYNNYINNYYWIKGEGSHYNKQLLNIFDKENFVPKKFFSFNFNNYYNNLLNLDIDMLYISISNPWIPPIYCNFIKNFILQYLNKEKIIYSDLPFFMIGNRKQFLFNTMEGEQNEISFNC